MFAATQSGLAPSITGNPELGLCVENGKSPWPPKSKNMTQRATTWSLTINNPCQEDEEQIELARQKGWRVSGQKEKGAAGTEHYQLMLQTPQVRFSAVKKQFPRAHIEVARNPTALSQYVAKADTRVASLPTAQEAYPSLSRYWDLIVQELDEHNYIHLNYVYENRWDRSEPVWFKDAPKSYTQNSLVALDDMTKILIEKGYRVESIAVNPATRAMWKTFHAEIIVRSINSPMGDRQTDRQARSDFENEIQVVNIPTYADEDARSQTTPGLLGEQHEEVSSEEGRS